MLAYAGPKQHCFFSPDDVCVVAPIRSKPAEFAPGSPGPGAALTGVKYKQEADGNFSHSNLITILNAEGEIVHQRAGLKGGLDEAAAALQAAARP